MTVRAVATPEAEEQIRTIDTWWRKERPAAPGLFSEELAAAIALLNNAPVAGRRYRHGTVPEVFRVWPSFHPGIAIEAIRMTPAVEFMVKRARPRSP